jgi:hypothetical protein
MLSIRFTVKGSESSEPRIVRVPTFDEALLTKYGHWNWSLERTELHQLVLDSGESQAASQYCRKAFTQHNLSLLEIHDGCGCVAKLI